MMGVIGKRLAARLDAVEDERGLTLIELLVTIAILGLIAVPLATALIIYFQHTDETTERLSLSHDVQISSAYFAQDVQSMGKRDWGADRFPLVQSVYTNESPSSPYPCGSVDTSALLVQLVWDDPGAGAAGPVWRVSYYLKPVSGGLSELHRIVCTGNPTPTSDLVLAHNVLSADAPPCADVCGPQPPETVTLDLHLKSGNSTVSDSFEVRLTGQRRSTT